MSKRCLGTAWQLAVLVLWLTGCRPAATPTPRPHTYVTFEEAYAEAARVVSGWYSEAVIDSAYAASSRVNSREDIVVPRLDGRAAVWLFGVVTPNRQSGVGVVDGRATRVDLGEKGGQMICVGHSWYPAPMATEEVLKRGSSVCFDPLPVRDMALQPQEFLPLAQVIELAQDAGPGFDALTLGTVRLARTTWTLTLEEDLVRIGGRHVVVEVEAKTGTIVSVYDSATVRTPTPEPE